LHSPCFTGIMSSRWKNQLMAKNQSSELASNQVCQKHECILYRQVYKMYIIVWHAWSKVEFLYLECGSRLLHIESLIPLWRKF
jgi:hypothetical protein